MGDKTAVSAMCWIPRGRCRPKPAAPNDPAPEDDVMDTELTEEEKKVADEFEMDDYDNEDDGEGMQFFQLLNDDHFTAGPDVHLTGDPDSDSESDVYEEVRPEDQLFVAVACEEDACTLEVYLYDPENCSMYVHHDIILPAYPLCVEWFDGLAPTHEGGVGNFAAVGSFSNAIDHQPSWNWNISDNASTVGTQRDYLAPNSRQHNRSTGRNRSRSPATRVEEQAAVTAALLQAATALPKAIDAKRTVHLSSLSVAQIAHDVYAGNIAKALPPLAPPPFPTIAAKASTNASAKAPTRASAKTSAKAPARASAKTSAKAPARASAKISAKAPTMASTKTSAKAPTRA